MILLQVSRLAKEDFERLVLTEDGEAIYFLDADTAREAGCQASWGVPSTHGSPLPLFVLLMGNMKSIDGKPVVKRYTGSWLRDMNIALEAYNVSVAADWIHSAVR